MIYKIVSINFVDPRINATDHFEHIAEAVKHASINLASRRKVTLRYPRKTDTGAVVVSLEIPDDFVDSFTIGRGLRGISNYLLETYSDEYRKYIVGKRLLIYAEVPTYTPLENRKDEVTMDEETMTKLIEKQTKTNISESQWKREMLEELSEIKKELQNIRVILENTTMK